MGIEVADWRSLLRELDQSGWDMPRDFDRAAVTARLGQLVERLSRAFNCELVSEPGLQDSVCFGYVRIPGAVSRTRAKRTHIRGVTVSVSYFDKLVACRPSVHIDDLARITPVLDELGYLNMPKHVQNLPYDGVMGSADLTWYDRFFTPL